MPGQPRRHHYIPQFYLAGFTDNGRPDGRLHVLDRSKPTQWVSTPKRCAHQRDFHAVDLGPDQDPMVVEKKLAQMEGQQSSVLRRILAEEALPPEDDETIGDLMSLVAFLAVRVPRIRRTVSDSIDRAEKARARASLATEEGPEEFRRFVEHHKATLSPMQRAEVERLLKDDPDLTKMAEFASSDEYTVSYGQTWDVQTMISMGIDLMPWLSRRNWSLWVAAERAPDLVCSDSPVSLTWAREDAGPSPAGFGVPGTVASVPLSKRIGLVGKFEPLPGRRVIGCEEVAGINSATSMYAEQVFSAQPDFVWKMRSGSLGGKAELLTALRSEGAEPPPVE